MATDLRPPAPPARRAAPAAARHAPHRRSGRPRDRGHEGTVWLTLDHDVRDIVLNAGDRFVTQEHRNALLYALAPARLEMAPAGIRS